MIDVLPGINCFVSKLIGQHRVGYFQLLLTTTRQIKRRCFRGCLTFVQPRGSLLQLTFGLACSYIDCLGSEWSVRIIRWFLSIRSLNRGVLFLCHLFYIVWDQHNKFQRDAANRHLSVSEIAVWGGCSNNSVTVTIDLVRALFLLRWQWISWSDKKLKQLVASSSFRRYSHFYSRIYSATCSRQEVQHDKEGRIQDQIQDAQAQGHDEEGDQDATVLAPPGWRSIRSDNSSNPLDRRYCTLQLHKSVYVAIKLSPLEIMDVEYLRTSPSVICEMGGRGGRFGGRVSCPRGHICRKTSDQNS